MSQGVMKTKEENYSIINPFSDIPIAIHSQTLIIAAQLRACP